MDQTVILVPMNCIKCSTPIPAEPDQVAWVCPVCDQCMYLDEETGLQEQEIYYSIGLTPAIPGKPYWVADGQVSLQRETFGSAKNSAEAQLFWGQPRRFFIPAYAASLEELLNRAKDLLLSPPILREGQKNLFQPVIMDKKDVSAAVEFLVVAIEADRSDRLKKVDFQLKISKPGLWILPA